MSIKRSLHSKAHAITSALSLALLAAVALTLGACGGGPESAQGHAAATLTPTEPPIQYGSLENDIGSQSVVPHHVSPVPGAEVRDTTPVLKWSEVSGAVSYEAQVSASRAFAPGETWSNTDAPWSWQLEEELTPQKTYYWRVRAVFPAGKAGAWSDHSPFFVPEPPPPTPTPTPTPGPEPEVEIEPTIESTVEPAATPTPVDGMPGFTAIPYGNLTISDKVNNEVLTAQDRPIDEVIRSLQPGRWYWFLATLDFTLDPRQYGVERPRVPLKSGKELLIMW